MFLHLDCPLFISELRFDHYIWACCIAMNPLYFE